MSGLLKGLGFSHACLPIHRKTSRAQPGPLARVPATSEAVAEDVAVGLSAEEPLSTGNEFLDRALVLHLNRCNQLLLVSAK